MGSVWAARNELTDRDFAIKFLLPALAQNKEALQRFFLEARACGQIKHPAVVDVYDMGQADDGSPYLVMEMLEGEGFDQRLYRSGAFRPAEAAAWLAFVARGLEEAHVRGLVHRDLKPGNIFFALDDRGDVIPKILDFGISKATNQNAFDMVKTTTGAVLGSPTYMSPEQASGDPDIDGRSDVWSLGVILYEALTGKLPFDANNYNALMVAIITREHQPVHELVPSIPPELSAIVDHALTKERADRIGTAREFAERLEAVAAALGGGVDLPRLQPKTLSLVPASTSGHPPGSTTQKTWSDGKAKSQAKQRSSVVVVASLVLVAALVGTGAFAFVRMQPPAMALTGRSVVVFKAHLAELRRELALQAKADAEGDAPAAATSGGAAAGGAAPGAASAAATATASAKAGAPSSNPPAVRRGGGRAGRPGGKRDPNDPSGGVDSAGF
jgi:serine/threonine-protein kinase